MTRADIVLVHGAWAGPWVWDTVVEPLDAAGHRPHAVTLPGVGATIDIESDVSLERLTDSVVDQIGSPTGPLVIVGHSGGGVIATQVAERLDHLVDGVVFVAGMMLPSGRTFSDICEAAKIPSPVGISAFLEFDRSRRISTVPVEAGAAVFFQRAEAHVAITAARALERQQESARTISPTWSRGKFGRLPRLYIEAIHDRSVPLATQRQMQIETPGAEVVTLDCDHAPQLSATDELVTSIDRFVTRVMGTSPHLAHS